MTFLSLAQGCRRLGIDAKTLRRWLAEAELALPCHPVDARKKGVSEEHLQALARLHHRHLADCEQKVAAPLPSQITMLPANLLSLPEQMCALQSQIATLQQQVADLTRLISQHAPAPTIAATQTQPKSRAKPAKKSTHSAHSAPGAASATAKPQSKPVHVIPRVEYGEGGHYVVICPKHGVLPFEPDSQEWFAWLREHDSFRFVGRAGHFTAHHEWRVKKGAWRAHRHIRNHVYTLRLAPVQELTIAVLEQAALALQSHLM